MPKLLIEKINPSRPVGVLPSEVIEVSEWAASDLMSLGVVYSVADPDTPVTGSLASHPQPPRSQLSTVDFSILDQSIPVIDGAIEGLAVRDLRALLDAERAGKTRKGVVDLLTKAIEAG